MSNSRERVFQLPPPWPKLMCKSLRPCRASSVRLRNAMVARHLGRLAALRSTKESTLHLCHGRRSMLLTLSPRSPSPTLCLCALLLQIAEEGCQTLLLISRQHAVAAHNFSLGAQL